MYISGYRARLIRQVVTLLGVFYIGILVVKRSWTNNCNDDYVVKRYSQLADSEKQPGSNLIQNYFDDTVLATNEIEINVSTTDLNGEDVTIKPGVRVSMSCADVRNLIADLATDKSSIHREDNVAGYRAVYYTSIYDVDDHLVNVVVKVANVYNETSETEQYRYNSALREINNLEKLHLLDFKGAPQVIISCVTSLQVAYIVTRVRNGVPICNDDSNDKRCSMAFDVLENIKSMPDPALKAVIWIEKVTSFFAQFEHHKIFVEDVSGSNFFYNIQTFDLSIVDADSLLFYENVPIFSRLSCKQDIDCPKPAGNLWGPNALNHKIYYSCRERDGYCVKNTCRGFDSSLHACGIGRWLIIPLRGLIPEKYYNRFREIMHCMTLALPQDRCSFTFASAKAKSLLEEIEYKNR